MNEVGPAISFAAGPMKRSATRVCPIQSLTVWRKEKTMTATPTIIATAAARDAIVTELRNKVRPRFCAASAGSIRPFRGRRAKRLKRAVTTGVIEEKAARTKKAAPAFPAFRLHPT